MDVFGSWSGKRSHAIATAFRDWLHVVLPSVNLWLSDDIPGGEKWGEHLAKRLSDLKSGLIFLTPNNHRAPWIYFEAGALSRTLGDSHIYPYLFDIELDDLARSPLSQFQARLANKEGTIKLVHDLNRRLPASFPEDSLTALLDKFWPDLQERYKEVRRLMEPVYHFERMEGRLLGSVRRLKSGLLGVDNKFLLQVLFESLGEYADRLDRVRADSQQFSLPYILYPTYLLALLKAFDAPQTKAIAVLDNDETFWPQRPGLEILRHTSPKSIRVFVFRSREHMRANISILEHHSRRYEVYAISYDILSKVVSRSPFDFSIIGDINSVSLLAVYNDDNPLAKSIKFTADKRTISWHHDLFLEVRDVAVPVKKGISLLEGGEELIELTFSPPPSVKLSQLDRKPVEMSSYIHVHDYDKHEERHAYYVEMMDKMLEIYVAHRDSTARTEVLELGAGTGIFTQRLVKTGEIDITAIEIDWVCYHILLEKMKRIEDMQQQEISSAQPEQGHAVLRNTFTSRRLNAVVKCDNEDCRTYNPPGTFFFIFSSFADHHIKPYDKQEYFLNIRRNLKPNGLVIVGDEFLPSYDELEPDSRERALRSYHRHIIEETKRSHGNDAAGLVKLEEAALESGLQAIGDFKVSCEIYERSLGEAGFAFEKERIGPRDREDLGGVYVYTLRRRE